MSSELSPVPLLTPVTDQGGNLTRVWAEWIRELFARVGGNSASTNTELAAALLLGRVVQDVFTKSGAVATGTTTIPYDDSIPQIAEGDEYITRSITPLATTNRLVIEAVLYVTSSADTRHLIAALFQDATAGALAAASLYVDLAGGGGMIVLRHEMEAGTTSATTFRIRIGADSAATVTFNGVGGARRFGGVTVSSLRVTERTPVT